MMDKLNELDSKIDGIPFHKRGKCIMFLKSEIDEWLHAGKIKSDKDLENEVAQFIKSKRKTRF